jgi:hypothetical protein
MTEETEQYRPVVNLVLARMESAPEEFERGHPRGSHWNGVLETINQWGTKAEKDAIRKARSDHYMGKAHHSSMKLILSEAEPEQVQAQAMQTGRAMSANAFRAIVEPHLNDLFEASFKNKL